MSTIAPARQNEMKLSIAVVATSTLTTGRCEPGFRRFEDMKKTWVPTIRGSVWKRNTAWGGGGAEVTDGVTEAGREIRVRKHYRGKSRADDQN